MPAYSTDRGFTGSTKDKPRATAARGQSTGAGALLSSGGANQTTKVTQPRDPAGPAGAISGGSNIGPGAKTPPGKPTGAASQQNAPGTAVQANPSAATTTDLTGRVVSEATVPYVSDPSAGQILGAVLGPVPLAGTINRLGGLAKNLAEGKDLTTDDGGLLGSAFDEERGVQPGAVTGYTGNRVASNTYARNKDDTRLADRASVLSGEVSGLGDATSGGDDGGAEFSSVKLTDRRRPYDDLSAVDLLRGLL